MPIITPAVLASTIEEFRTSLDKVNFADRIQIDLMDGIFVESASVKPEQTYAAEGQLVDYHVMYIDPTQILETLIAKLPHTIIFHAESSTFREAFYELGNFDVRRGVALLPETQPEQVADFLVDADHCLIFGGKLGHYGGQADLDQLTKCARIRNINQDIEISWDGGANAENYADITAAGIDVVAMGGAVQKAQNPQKFVDSLTS